MTDALEKLILDHCNIAVSYMAWLSQEDFAVLRKNGFGASDAAVLLGMRPYGKTVEALIEEKCTVGYTEADRKISELVNVRKGKDLEPLILQRFAEQTHTHLTKPDDMYNLKEAPYLAINYDGVIDDGADLGVPVEAKFISIGGEKYWDFNMPARERAMPRRATVEEQYNAAREYYGMPSYYYTQVQQQLMGTKAPYAYLVGLRDKTWDLHIIRIFADPYIQNLLIAEGYKVWQKILARRGT